MAVQWAQLQTAVRDGLGGVATRAHPPPCPSRRRAHFAFVYLNVFWASWLIIEYYKVRCVCAACWWCVLFW